MAIASIFRGRPKYEPPLEISYLQERSETHYNKSWSLENHHKVVFMMISNRHKPKYQPLLEMMISMFRT